jgi:hypothetical protein
MNVFNYLLLLIYILFETWNLFTIGLYIGAVYSSLTFATISKHLTHIKLIICSKIVTNILLDPSKNIRRLLDGPDSAISSRIRNRIRPIISPQRPQAYTKLYGQIDQLVTKTRPGNGLI